MWDPKAPDLAEGFYGLNSATSCAYTSRNQDRKHSGKHFTIMSILDWSLKNLWKIFWTFGEGGDFINPGLTWHLNLCIPLSFWTKVLWQVFGVLWSDKHFKSNSEVPIGPQSLGRSFTDSHQLFFSFHIGAHMILAPHHSNMLNLPFLFTTRKQHPNIDIWKWHRFPQISSTPFNWTLWGSKVYSNPFYMSNHHFPLLNIAYMSNGSWFLAWRIWFLEKWFRKMPLDRNLLGGFKPVWCCKFK